MAYAGHRYHGAQARYVMEALGAKRAEPAADRPFDFDEFMGEIVAELASFGIGPAAFMRWTIDQLALYVEGRALLRKRSTDAAIAIVEQASQQKVDPLVRYVLPVY